MITLLLTSAYVASIFWKSFFRLIHFQFDDSVVPSGSRSFKHSDYTTLYKTKHTRYPVRENAPLDKAFALDITPSKCTHSNEYPSQKAFSKTSGPTDCRSISSVACHEGSMNFDIILTRFAALSTPSFSLRTSALSASSCPSLLVTSAIS